MAETVVDKVVKWVQSREEFQDFTSVERDVEVRGRNKDLRYVMDVVLRRYGKLSFLFKTGPLSGSAIAIKVKTGKGNVSAQEVRAMQGVAADIVQAVINGKEKLPIEKILFISDEPYDDEAVEAASMSRLLWCGYMDDQGNVRPVR